MADKFQDLQTQLEALFSMAVAHMESVGANTRPVETTSAVEPDRKRKKLFHTYQQTKQLLGDLRSDVEACPVSSENQIRPMPQPQAIIEQRTSLGEEEESEIGHQDGDRHETTSGPDDHDADPNFQPCESSDDTSQPTDGAECDESDEITTYENDNESCQTNESEDIDNALLVPVIGQVTGMCQSCKQRAAQTVCYTCGTGQFCGYDCWRDSHDNIAKHQCSDIDKPWPACDVMEDIVNDRLPYTRYFGFDSCCTANEKSTLLGLYRDLWFSYGLNMFQLQKWWEFEEIYNNIVKTYNRRPDLANYTYVSWFKRRGPSLFPLEYTSEVLDMDLFN